MAKDFEGEKLLELVGEEHGIRLAPLPKERPAKAPCRYCLHPFEDHVFMYGLGQRDFFRCLRPTCRCGDQFKVQAAVVDPEEAKTEAGRRRIMERLARQ